MARERLTWKTRQWSEGAWIEPLPALRKKYGIAVEETVATFAEMIRERRDRPKMQDVKRTLRHIAAEPATVVLDRLDSDTECMLMRESWLHYRCADLEALQPTELVACAALALLRPMRGSGRIKMDDLVLMLGRAMCAHAHATGMSAMKRYDLVEEALLARGIGAGHHSVKALLSKAG